MRHASLFILALASAAAMAQTKLLLSDLATDGRQIVFNWTGRLWTVPIAGGEANLAFNDDMSRGFPWFSPDGKTLAYTNLGDGEVYARLEDGTEKRLTFHPKMDQCRGWTEDGRAVYFSSSREMDGKMELYRVGLDGIVEERLPLWQGLMISQGPGTLVAYVPDTIFGTSVNRRFYRGGAMGHVYTLDLSTGKRHLVSHAGSNTVFPHWIGDRLICANDKLASLNLISYDLKSNKERRYTDFHENGIVAMTVKGKDAIFARDGELFRCDLASGAINPVPVTLNPAQVAALDQRGPKTVPLSRAALSFIPSFDGKSMAIEARGEVVLWNRHGAARVIAGGSASAERLPTLSPDGKEIAYFSDGSGEYRLIVRQLEGGSETVIPIEAHSTFYSELEWSPDGRHLSFSDQRVSLWVADIQSRSAKKVDESKHMAQGFWNPDWSPDGRWLAYSKALPSRVRSIHLYDTQTGKSTQVTDGFTHAEFPVFDKSGRYLYFSGSANARNASAHDIGWALMSDLRQQPLTTKKLNLVVLSRSDLSPLLPGVDLDHILKVGPTQIDLEGIGDRIVPIPLSERDIQDVEAGTPGTIFVQCNNWVETPGLIDAKPALFRWTLRNPRTLTALGNPNAFEVSGDGSTLMTLIGSTVKLSEAGASPIDSVLPGDVCDLSKTSIPVDLKAEWAQMYHEAFRMMRDIFYDPNHHGRDLAKLERQYERYLDGIVQRPYLNQLLYRAFGEVSVSHLQVGGGDAGAPPARPNTQFSGLLGADYEISEGRYRFKKILRNGDYMLDNPLTRAPLAQPGIDVRVGDYLISVEGQDVRTEKSIHLYFAGKAGRPTKIKVSPSPTGANAREYTVSPLSGENGLRRANWVRERRELVDKLSDGKLAYVFISDHSFEGFNEFSRVLNGSQERQGLIVDQRYNGGGISADYQIEALLRKAYLAYDYRYGGEITFPSNRIDGSKVLMINQENGSAAETFAMMFRSAGVGKIVGVPTYGGGIGAALFQQRLVDAGVVAIPNRGGYNPLTGNWEIENIGVQPDVRVDEEPEDFLAGRDRQLEAAVRVALDELKKYKKPVLKRPKPPIHGGQGEGHRLPRL